MHQGPLCNETKFVVLSEFEVTERQISSYFLAVYYLNGETASLTVCPNGKQKCPMVSSVPIDDLPFTQKRDNYLPKETRSTDRKSTRLNSSHTARSRMPSSA